MSPLAFLMRALAGITSVLVLRTSGLVNFVSVLVAPMSALGFFPSQLVNFTSALCFFPKALTKFASALMRKHIAAARGDTQCQRVQGLRLLGGRA